MKAAGSRFYFPILSLNQVPFGLAASRPLDPGGILRLTPEGIHCPAGGFHVDPRRPVARAVVTHAHADHARPGSGAYLCASAGAAILRERVGGERSPPIEGQAFGESRKVGEVRLSFHPAGHLLGSAQVRVEKDGYVCVVSGDYKRDPDPTAETFEPVRCDSFFTECTFGLPAYRWPDPGEVAREINDWWRGNRERGVTSVLFAYALGKAQRLLSLVDDSIGPVGVHGAVARFSPHYARAGAPLARHRRITVENRDEFRGKGLVVAPGSAAGTPWLRRFQPLSTAFASGWMRIRGNRRRRALDRGFVVSDHVDWPGLLRTIRETEAGFVGAMHGFTGPLARYLRETGLEAIEVEGFQERDDPTEES